jgi:hypothetical protein
VPCFAGIHNRCYRHLRIYRLLKYLFKSNFAVQSGRSKSGAGFKRTISFHYDLIPRGLAEDHVFARSHFFNLRFRQCQTLRYTFPDVGSIFLLENVQRRDHDRAPWETQIIPLCRCLRSVRHFAANVFETVKPMQPSKKRVRIVGANRGCESFRIPAPALAELQGDGDSHPTLRLTVRSPICCISSS